MSDATDVMLPLEGTISAVAAREEIGVSGLLHVVAQVTTRPVCSEARLQARVIGGSGIGRTTGQRYVVDGTATLQQQIGTGATSCPPFQVFFYLAPPVTIDSREADHTIVLPVEIRTEMDATGTLTVMSAEILTRGELSGWRQSAFPSTPPWPR